MPYRYPLPAMTKDDEYHFRRKEIAHVLGLQDNEGEHFENTGWWKHSAINSCRERYSEISTLATSKDASTLKNPKQLNLSNLVSAFEGANDPIAHGTYHGFSTQWPGHAFSIHKVQENDQIHYIYFNRGESHKTGFDKTVVVFSVPISPPEESETFERNFFDVCKSTSKKSASKEAVGAFIDQAMQSNYYNQALSDHFSGITPQTTGNCSVANTNIAWHLQMAADYMQKHPTVDFAKAYDITEERYQKYRTRDKSMAFEGLLAIQDGYLDYNNYYKDIGYVLAKFHSRDREYLSQPMIKNLLSYMEMPYIIHLYTMMNMGVFDAYISADVKDAWAMSIEEHFARRPEEIKAVPLQPSVSRIVSKIQNFMQYDPEQQSSIIETTPSYLKYASPDLQQTFVQRDPALYLKLASENVQLEEIQNDPRHYLKHARQDIQEIFYNKEPIKYLKYTSRDVQLSVLQAFPDSLDIMERSLQVELVKENPQNLLRFASEKIQQQVIEESPEAYLKFANREVQMEYCAKSPEVYMQHASTEAQMEYFMAYPETYSAMSKQLQVDIAKPVGYEGYFDLASPAAQKQMIKEAPERYLKRADPEIQMAACTKVPETYLKHASPEVLARYNSIHARTTAEWRNILNEVKQDTLPEKVEATVTVGNSVHK